jgi:hypothetical protein
MQRFLDEPGQSTDDIACFDDFAEADPHVIDPAIHGGIPLGMRENDDIAHRGHRALEQNLASAGGFDLGLAVDGEGNRCPVSLPIGAVGYCRVPGNRPLETRLGCFAR